MLCFIKEKIWWLRFMHKVTYFMVMYSWNIIKRLQGFYHPAVHVEAGECREKRWSLQNKRRQPVRKKMMLSGRSSFLESLVFCQSKIFRNLLNNAIMHTICPPGYYNNAFMGFPDFRHSIYGFYGYSIFLFIKKNFELI